MILRRAAEHLKQQHWNRAAPLKLIGGLRVDAERLAKHLEGATG